VVLRISTQFRSNSEQIRANLLKSEQIYYKIYIALEQIRANLLKSTQIRSKSGQIYSNQGKSAIKVYLPLERS